MSKRMIALIGMLLLAAYLSAGDPDKAAEFFCQVGKTTLKTSFDFQRMADAQGLNLSGDSKHSGHSESG